MKAAGTISAVGMDECSEENEDAGDDEHGRRWMGMVGTDEGGRDEGGEDG